MNSEAKERPRILMQFHAKKDFTQRAQRAQSKAGTVGKSTLKAEQMIAATKEYREYAFAFFAPLREMYLAEPLREMHWNFIA